VDIRANRHNLYRSTFHSPWLSPPCQTPSNALSSLTPLFLVRGGENWLQETTQECGTLYQNQYPSRLEKIAVSTATKPQTKGEDVDHPRARGAPGCDFVTLLGKSGRPRVKGGWFMRQLVSRACLVIRCGLHGLFLALRKRDIEGDSCTLLSRQSETERLTIASHHERLHYIDIYTHQPGNFVQFLLHGCSSPLNIQVRFDIKRQNKHPNA
jgi:hypothetical protein